MADPASPQVATAQVPAAAPAPPPKFIEPNPPIGLPIVWYENAVRTGKAWPAFIRGVNPYGTCEILIFKGSYLVPRQCAHIDSPRTAKMDHYSRNQNGAWDFIHGMAVDKNKHLPLAGEGSTEELKRELAQARQEMADLRKDLFGDPNEDDLEDRILKIARLHPDNARKIAEICACPVQKVNGVLQRARRHQAEEANA